MSGHDVERAYVQAVLANADAQLADTTASMRAEVDRLRESWASGYDQQLAGHEARLQAARDETRAWLRAMYDDDEAAPEPASNQDVPQGQGRQGVSGAEPATAPSAPGPGELNPHELAAEISQLSMAEYGARRRDLGVQSPESMNRLFG